MAVNQAYAIDSKPAAGAAVPATAPRMPACGCGVHFLPHRPSQTFCSRRCASLARPVRPRLLRRPPRSNDQHDRLILRLLDIQPLERRARGGWRFGTKCIGDVLVARLIASGRAEIRGERLHHVTEA